MQELTYVVFALMDDGMPLTSSPDFRRGRMSTSDPPGEWRCIRSQKLTLNQM